MVKCDKLTVTILGAGGKMGSRITNNLMKKDYNLYLCEKGEKGIENILNKGLEVSDAEIVIPESDIVVMAVPDSLIGKISKDTVPLMKNDSTMIILDPAAAFAEEVTLRDDCTFVVTHPCHAPLFREQDTVEARRDYFGGIAAKQDILIALYKGSEKNFEKAKTLCKDMFAPVENCFRVTVDQMAFLEPAVSEVIGATCANIMKEAVYEAVKYGIPEEAAESFLLGHINVLLAIYFKKIDADVSDACKIAVNCGKRLVFRDDWRKVFNTSVIKEVVNEMLRPDAGA
jgi:hypothetical protein